MKASKIIMYVLLIGATLSFLYPFYWMLLASLTPEAQIGELGLMPKALTFSNYTQMAGKIPIGRALLNSFMVASLSTAGILVFGP
jgi:multiple sugar transport system permease protein